MQQSFITNEPWLYQNEIEDWGGQPIDFLVVAEFGWEAYPGVGSLSVRPDVIEEEADCLEVLVPRIQQAAVEFAQDPSDSGSDAINRGVHASDGFDTVAESRPTAMGCVGDEGEKLLSAWPRWSCWKLRS